MFLIVQFIMIILVQKLMYTVNIKKDPKNADFLMVSINVWIKTLK